MVALHTGHIPGLPGCRAGRSSRLSGSLATVYLQRGSQPLEPGILICMAPPWGIAETPQTGPVGQVPVVSCLVSPCTLVPCLAPAPDPAWEARKGLAPGLQGGPWTTALQPSGASLSPRSLLLPWDPVTLGTSFLPSQKAVQGMGPPRSARARGTAGLPRGLQLASLPCFFRESTGSGPPALGVLGVSSHSLCASAPHLGTEALGVRLGVGAQRPWSPTLGRNSSGSSLPQDQTPGCVGRDPTRVSLP